MQTIQSKYLNPTDTKGARIKATNECGMSNTVDFNYGVETKAAHIEAINALRVKLGDKWMAPMVVGSCNAGYIAVFCNDTII